MGERGQGPDAAVELARQLEAELGDDLRSVVLYGSAAREEYREGTSDLNVLVVLTAVDEPVLRRCAELAVRWSEAGNPPPLLLGEEELRRSLDIFPIEFSEIRAANRVLNGFDPFAELQVDFRWLRLQCERELKTALIQIRERYLLSTGDDERIGDLLRGSVATLVVHCRTILRLAGDVPATDSVEVVRAVAERAAFDPEPVVLSWEARHSRDPFRVAAGSPTAAGYLNAAARLVSYVDGL